MLINSFPHPAVTGSDLAATLTENKTINVTCRPENASVHTHTHAHKLHRYILSLLLLYVYNIHAHSPRIDLYNIMYRYIDRGLRGYYDDKSYISYAHTCTVRSRRRRRDKPRRYYIIIFSVGVVYRECIYIYMCVFVAAPVQCFLQAI